MPDCCHRKRSLRKSTRAANPIWCCKEKGKVAFLKFNRLRTSFETLGRDTIGGSGKKAVLSQDVRDLMEVPRKAQTDAKMVRIQNIKLLNNALKTEVLLRIKSARVKTLSLEFVCVKSIVFSARLKRAGLLWTIAVRRIMLIRLRWM